MRGFVLRSVRAAVRFVSCSSAATVPQMRLMRSCARHSDAMRHISRAVVNCPSLSAPWALVKLVCVQPSAAARAFICLTKAETEPPT